MPEVLRVRVRTSKDTKPHAPSGASVARLAEHQRTWNGRVVEIAPHVRVAALGATGVACLLTGAYVGPTLAIVQDAVDPRARAFSVAVLLLVVNLIGASIGPFAVGMLSDALAPSAGLHSVRYALLGMPALLALNALCYARARIERSTKD